MREIRMLRSKWRGLETESRLGLHGHERGNPGHRQGHDLTDHRASPRPYQAWSNPSPGNGFRNETLLEVLYRVEIAKAISITPDLQLVFDPADNPGDDFVVVPGVRLHLKF